MTPDRQIKRPSSVIKQQMNEKDTVDVFFGSKIKCRCYTILAPTIHGPVSL